MNTEYLPGDVRQRIQDLIKEKDTNQSAVASTAGISDSTLSRFLTSRTDKLSNKSIAAIADALGVTTDFLLGKVNIPYRTNYDIEELGLSADAAKVLYTNRTAAAVVSAMLESKAFPTFAQMVRQYIEGTVAAGYAAQNQMYGMISNMIGGLGPEAAMDVAALRKPVDADELNNIHETLDRMLKGIREDTHTKLEQSRAMTAEVMQQMMEELPKGKDIQSVTPEQIMDAITATISGMDGVTDEVLDSFKQAALPLFQLPIEHDNDGTQMEAAERFDPEHGTAFLTYAGYWVRKRMQEYLSATMDHTAISLQEISNLEDRGVQDFSGNGYVQSPEAILLRKERMEELCQGIRAISDRDRTYLFYRYGFPDEPENRTLKETAAHFHLSQSRAKSTEKKALEDLRLELPWWHR